MIIACGRKDIDRHIGCQYFSNCPFGLRAANVLVLQVFRYSSPSYAHLSV